MENLKFTIEDSELAELLGRQNFSTKESAVFELLKNSFDSGSKNCDIYIDEDKIRILDTGKGMNEDDIRKNWMHVGKSNKGYKDEDNERILTGSKGVGRFALARLGNKVIVVSKKGNNNAIAWESNWDISSFNNIKVDFEKGTHIEINDLRDKWRSKDIENLIHFLNRAYKKEDMEVNVYNNGFKRTVKSVYKDIKSGINFASNIKLKYDSRNTELKVTINSDEFESDILRVLPQINTQFFEDLFNMKNELKSNINKEEFNNYLSELGNFEADFYFSLDRQPVDLAKKFMYKYNGLADIENGIALYRNGFSISSFEGKKDWLEIASRARKSPAAATHSTGSWRVRLNQLYGFVSIDKQENANLKDLANRQGLEEDEFYSFFIEIIQFGIGRFEKYRQSIIREINMKNNLKVLHEKDDKRKLNAFLNKPTSVSKMTKKEINSLVTEIKDIQKEVKDKSNVYKESEQKHKYDVRILNVLATQGLRASAIAHELQNKKNALISGYNDIISALEEYGFWEELNSSEYTRVSYKNVPKTLASLQEINVKLIAFLDVMLSKTEKNRFSSSIDSIDNVISTITNIWSNQYNWLDFNIVIEDEVKRDYQFSYDVIEVILDNLILNSIQHNEMKDRLSINMRVSFMEEIINVHYNDNGIGLHEKYKKDPKRILEVHESSRTDGHGLGMWIINNTLHMYGGQVVSIGGEKGFDIILKIKG